MRQSPLGGEPAGVWRTLGVAQGPAAFAPSGDGCGVGFAALCGFVATAPTPLGFADLRPRRALLPVVWRHQLSICASVSFAGARPCAAARLT